MQSMGQFRERISLQMRGNVVCRLAKACPPK